MTPMRQQQSLPESPPSVRDKRAFPQNGRWFLAQGTGYGADPPVTDRAAWVGPLLVAYAQPATRSGKLAPR
jgi:hypothetical protein